MTTSMRKLSPGVLSLLLVAGCDNPTVLYHDHSHGAGQAAYATVSAGQLEGLAKEVRNVTSRFHSTTQATRAGYVVDSPCVAVPGLGGMGFHWVEHSLVDPVFDPLHPEAVLYEPSRNGRPRLIALEYIVINTGQTAPTFDGQPFDVGGAPIPAPHWTLHVWVHRENPSGLFAPFNPDVVCP